MLKQVQEHIIVGFKDSPKIFQGSSLQMVSQVHNQTTNSMRKSFSTQTYNGDSIYLSSMHAWIDRACESNHSPWQEFQGFQIHKFLHQYVSIMTKILVCTRLILDEILSWIISKDKAKRSGMNDMLRWLHRWYDFT